ncbi:MAG: choice-of-anchor D domain-containing protein, partial [Archangium sp.]|nr:choice-of-anchor D domain-containing protein [Archangium sp.]
MRAWLTMSMVVLAGCPAPTPQTDGGLPEHDAGGPLDGGAPDAGGADAGAYDAGQPQVELTQLDVDFGSAACGAEAPQRTWSMKNSGTAPLDYSSDLGGFQPAGFRIVSGASGTIAPGATGTLTLAVKTSPVSDAQPNSLSRAQLVVHTNDPVQPGFSIPLQFQLTGSTVLATDVHFGDQAIGAQVTFDTALYNYGPSPVTVALAVAPPFSVPDGGLIVVPPTPLGPPPVPTVVPVTFTPSSALTANVAVGITIVSGDVCTADRALTLSGRGTNGQLTGGGDLDFGLTDCGDSAPAKSVSFGNAGSSAFQLTAATLGKGSASPFTISGFVPGTSVSPSGSVAISIAPKPIPAQVDVVPGDFSDVLTVTTSLDGGSPQVVQLTQGARGAIIEWSTPSIAAPDIAPNQTSQQLARLFNFGNLPVRLQLGPTPSAFTSPADVLVPAGGEARVPVSFSPTTAGRLSGTLNVSTPSAALCRPLPGAAALTGNAVTSGFTVSPTFIELSGACGGATPTAEGTFDLSNPSSSPIDVTVALSANPSRFVFANGQSSVAVPIAAGATARVVVRWNGGAFSSGAPWRVEEPVTFTSNVAGEPPRQGTVAITPVGPRISVSSPGPIVRSGELSVRNSGNLPASVSFSFNQASFSAPTTQVPPGQVVAVPVGFSGTAPGDVSST